MPTCLCHGALTSATSAPAAGLGRPAREALHAEQSEGEAGPSGVASLKDVAQSTAKAVSLVMHHPSLAPETVAAIERAVAEAASGDIHAVYGGRGRGRALSRLSLTGWHGQQRGRAQGGPGSSSCGLPEQRAAGASATRAGSSLPSLQPPASSSSSSATTRPRRSATPCSRSAEGEEWLIRVPGLPHSCIRSQRCRPPSVALEPGLNACPAPVLDRPVCRPPRRRRKLARR